jgi:putative acetyltransferase
MNTGGHVISGKEHVLAIEQVITPTDDARTLIGELDAELHSVYSAEQRHGLSIEQVFEPEVLFFVARLDGEAVGCGGVSFKDGLAEVKRMYVRPSVRGKSVARAILAHLEEQARARGITSVVLETGDAQHAAIRFYQRAGFRHCTAFGSYARMPPHAVERSVFFEKRIADIPIE